MPKIKLDGQTRKAQATKTAYEVRWILNEWMNEWINNIWLTQNQMKLIHRGSCFVVGFHGLVKIRQGKILANSTTKHSQTKTCKILYSTLVYNLMFLFVILHTSWHKQELKCYFCVLLDILIATDMIFFTTRNLEIVTVILL